MTSNLLIRTALATAGVLCLAGPVGGAEAAKRAPSEALYDMTFRAEMTDRWQAREHYTDDCKLTGAMCVRNEDGQGNARLNVRTRRPFRMLVMKGFGGRGPMINVGTGEGAPVSGPYLRNGSLVTEYSGPWDAANPDRTADAGGCGNKTLDGSINFMWHGRNRLGLSPILDDLREDCPTGPHTGWEWDGDESPSLNAVIAQVSQNKFLRTRQFTVRGSRTWTGKVPPFNRSDKQGSYVKDGHRTVSWTWEATFRMVKRRR